MLSPELQAVGALAEAAKLANAGEPSQAIDRAQEAIRILTPLAMGETPAEADDA